MRLFKNTWFTRFANKESITDMDMKYKSEIYEVIHQDAVANFEIGAISKTEMQKFDKMCLVKETDALYTVDKAAKAEYAAIQDVV